MPLTEAQKRAQKKYYAKIRLDPEFRQAKRDYASQYRKENPVKVAKCLHGWYLKNIKSHRANAKKWATENKERDLLNHSKWVSNNREKVLESSLRCHKRMRDNLEDTYIKGLLTNHNSLLTFKDIPQSLIEIKRIEIQMKRYFKEQANG